MQALSILRKSVNRNLLVRPVDSPLGVPDSGSSSEKVTADLHSGASSERAESHTIRTDQLIHLFHNPSHLLIVDTRQMGPFLDSHLPRSANLSIPSLILKRLGKSMGTSMTSWDGLGGFVSTPAGRKVWDSMDKGSTVVLVGAKEGDEMVQALRGILGSLVEGGDVRVLKDGWRSIMGTSAEEILVRGESSSTSDPAALSSSSPPKYTTYVPPPAELPSMTRNPSMPSLRDASRRNLPTLTIPGTSRRPPKLSLNVDRQARSATLPSFPADIHATQGASRLMSKANGLSINVGASNGWIGSLQSPNLSSGSFQTLCHAQSKLPPSPSSFGGVHAMREDQDVFAVSKQTPSTPWTASTARPDTLVPPQQSYNPRSPGLSGFTTARNALSPFIVSTILPSFLYLGPEIVTPDDVEKLKKMGVKRILNVAIECDDDESLGLKKVFERYLKVPMRDIVEESGVGRGMRESCDFLGTDQATRCILMTRRCSAPFSANLCPLQSW
jgi:hypothetical protein